MSFLFINKTLRLNNLKTRTTLNVKISVFVICVEAIIHLLLYNLHDCTFKQLNGKILSRQSGIPALQKRDSALPGWNFLHVIARYNLWRIYDTAGIPAKTGQNCTPANWDQVITIKGYFLLLGYEPCTMYHVGYEPCIMYHVEYETCIM